MKFLSHERSMSQSINAACFHLYECHGRAHRAHILPNTKLCHAADFFGNDVQMVLQQSLTRGVFSQTIS